GVGEPGVGKPRALEEFAERVRAQGTLVLWGRCYEGEAGRPFGPFAEAIGEYARTAAAEALAADLGLGGALARPAGAGGPGALRGARAAARRGRAVPPGPGRAGTDGAGARRSALGGC